MFRDGAFNYRYIITCLDFFGDDVPYLAALVPKLFKSIINSARVRVNKILPS